jgi:3,4-dihydroxy 2-butanone 4-phosphate synthase / GTP cyclohydrolase II
MKQTLDTISEAIEAIKKGEIIIVVDDEDRENEGDFLMAARHVTPEHVNFMATHGRGLICAPLIEDRCDELGLELMVRSNSAIYETPFTVSVDLLGHGCTTGISAHDRAKTIQALIDPKINPEELGKPGHIFPLRARRGGVLRRAGHTEAAIDFARLAGLEPAGVIVEIMNEDGSMARLPQLFEIAHRFGLKIVSIEDLIAHRLQHETLIDQVAFTEMQTRYGAFDMYVYRQTTNGCEHIALTKGHWDDHEPVLVRVHPGNPALDIFGAEHPARGGMLHRSMEMIEKEGKGVIIYINRFTQENHFSSEVERFKTDKSESGPGKRMDEKDYGIGAQILRALGVHKLRVISNTPAKRTGIIGYGLEITEYVEG